MGNEAIPLYQKILAIVVPVLLAGITYLTTVIYKRFIKYIDKRDAEAEQTANDKRVNSAMRWAADIIYGIAGATQQEIMMQAHKKVADGIMTKEELADIGRMAKQKALAEAQALTLGRLQTAANMSLDAAKAYIDNTLETAVLMTKAATAPLLPAPPQSQEAPGLAPTSMQSEQNS